MPVVPAQVIRVNEGLADVYGEFGQGTGALAAALLRYYSQRPTPQQPGMLRFPSGATTPTSPQELAAIRQAGGLPTTTGQQLPLARLPATIPGLPVEPGTAGYQPPNRFNLPPNVADIARLQQMANVSELATAPLKRQQLEQSIEQSKAMTAWLKSIPGSSDTGETEMGTDETGTPVPGKILKVGNRKWLAIPSADGKSLKLTEVTPKEPTKATDTERYRQSLQNAVGAIRAGKDRRLVRQRLLDEFPDKGVEIEKDLVFSR